MTASAVLRLATCLCLASTSAPPSLRAQPAPVGAQELGIELRYEASPGCPERSAFVKNVKARGGSGSSGSVTRLEVQLRAGARDEGQGQAVTGTIATTARDGVRSQRRVEAQSCAEASDALALIAALALEGSGAPDAASAGGNARVVRERDHGASARRAAERQDTHSSDEERAAGHAPSGPHGHRQGGTQDTRSATAAAAGPRRAHAPKSDSPAAPVEVHENDTTTRGATRSGDVSTERPAVGAAAEEDGHEKGDDNDGDSAGPMPAQARALRAYLLAAGGVGAGILPSPQPLLQLSLKLERGAPGTLLIAAGAGLRISPDQARSLDAGVVTFGWWTGLLAGCLGARTVDGRLALSGCAQLEAGALRGRARDTLRPQDETRPWLAVGPGLTLAYDPVRPLRIELHAEALTPLVHDRFLLAQEKVHEPETLGFRAGIALGLRL